jgi:hypothetical protein
MPKVRLGSSTAVRVLVRSVHSSGASRYRRYIDGMLLEQVNVVTAAAKFLRRA